MDERGASTSDILFSGDLAAKHLFFIFSLETRTNGAIRKVNYFRTWRLEVAVFGMRASRLFEIFRSILPVFVIYEGIRSWKENGVQLSPVLIRTIA